MLLSYQNTLGAFIKIRENMMTLAMYLAFDWVPTPSIYKCTPLHYGLPHHL